jgi:predicted RNase H-like nuclease (RuvC/YqgF family)
MEVFMNNSFKKIVLVITSAASSIGTYMFSGAGAAAATLGSLTAVTVFAVEKKKATKPEKIKENKKITKKSKQPTNKTAQKKELRKKITTKKSELKKHRSELKKLKRTGSGATPEAQKHSTIIEDLEDEIKNIKKDLNNL